MPIAFTIRGLPDGDLDAMLAAAMDASMRHSWPGLSPSLSWGTGKARLQRKTFRAACRAQVRLATLEPFDPDHERACPKCRAAEPGGG